MTCAALVTAGGYGTRIGADIPKQYLDLEGVPILARTLLVFQDHALIDLVAVTVPPGDEEFCRAHVLSRFNLSKVKHLVPGGETRQRSVFNGLKTLEHTEMVVIHDGVRPLVSSRIITQTIQAARHMGAALAGVPVRETVKKKTGSYIQTVNRTSLWLAHTPQTFTTRLILEAHLRAMKEDFLGTDDACLVERLGHPVEVIEDTPDNIKITTPLDLVLAGLLIQQD
jgi:2-C-methyl-D-erythritol 4-phosphate cytidylyltransferase